MGELHPQGARFVSLTDAGDTGTPSGRFFVHVMASLALVLLEERARVSRSGRCAAPWS